MRVELTRRRAVHTGLTGILCTLLAGRAIAKSSFIRPKIETVLPLVFAIPDFVTTDPVVPEMGSAIARSVGGILERSGGFARAGFDDVDDRDVGVDRAPRFSAWASRNIDILVVGAMTRLPDNRIRAAMRVWGIAAGIQIIGVSYFARNDAYEALGQALAGAIYERLGEYQR
jgi:TolB protein